MQGDANGRCTGIHKGAVDVSDQSYLDFLAELGVSSAHPGGFILTKAILDREVISQDSVVLDVGCGTGRTSVYIAETYNCKVTALDAHPIMLQKAKERFKKSTKHIELIDGNVESLPFDDNTFDIVIAESVTAFTNIPVSLKEYQRVLKNNGLLIEVEMTSEEKLSSESEKEIKSLYDVTQVLTEENWLAAIKSAGFSEISSYRGVDLDEETAKPEANLDAASFLFSKSINIESFQIWLEHMSLMKKYQDVLQYRVYRGKKNKES